MVRPIYSNVLNTNIKPNEIALLAYNPSAIHLLKSHIHLLGNIEWHYLSKQPYAIHLLEQYPDKIIWDELCKNPAAMHLLKQNINRINWNILSGNPGAISLLEENLDKINWTFASTNINAIHLLEQNLDKDIDWIYISENINAIPIIEKNLDKVDWTRLSCNINAVHLFEANISKLNFYNLAKNPNAIPVLTKYLTGPLGPLKNDIYFWELLSTNSNAISLLEQNLDKINWNYLMENTNIKAIELLQKNVMNNTNMKEMQIFPGKLCLNPSAIPIIEQYLDKLTPFEWMCLSSNPNAVHILEKNMDKICWSVLCKNPNAIHLIAKLDYEKMRSENQPLFQELIAYLCHPNWIQKCANRLNLDFDKYQDLLIESNVI